ncbi:MAG: hypothetical protein ACK576_02500 [Cyclobacteriaceae bacterium]
MGRAKLFSMLVRVLKVTGMAVALVLLLFGIATWIVVERKNDWLLSQVQAYMNESQSGQLEVAKLDLKLFRNFPNVTLQLNGIAYYEHRDTLRQPSEQPIMYADQLFVAVEFLPLLKEELNVAEISLSGARVNIIEYQNGVLNIEWALAGPTKAKVKPKVVQKKVMPPAAPAPKHKKVTPVTQAPPKSAINFDLQFITMERVQVTWKSIRTRDSSTLLIGKLEAKIRKAGKLLTASLSTTSQVQSVYVSGSRLPSSDLMIEAELDVETVSQHVAIRTCQINYDIFSATLEGTYAHRDDRALDLRVDASSNDLQLLSTFIKTEVIKQNPGLLKKLDIYARGRVFGKLKHQSPQFQLAFGVNDLSLQLPGQPGALQDIGFDGSFISGTAPDYSTAVLEVNNLKGKLPGGFFDGYLRIKNRVAPYVQYKLNAQVQLDAFNEIFRIDFLQQLRGSITLHGNFDGPLKYFAEHTMDSSRSSSITLNNLSFVVAKTNQRVSGLSGKIENGNNQTTVKQLAFTYGQNDLLINASIENLVYFLVGPERNLSVSGNLRSKQLFTKDFITDTLLRAQVQDRISNFSVDFKASTAASRVKSALPNIAFDIRNLTASFDELPNIKSLNASGLFSETPNGYQLDLPEFHAILPQGKLDVSGDLHVPEKRLWEFNARVKATQFPWTYVKELVAEMTESKTPSAKNALVKDMDVVTADLDLSAAVITYPFDINQLDVRNSRIHFTPSGSKPISVEKLNLALDHLHFTHPANSGYLTGLKSTAGTLKVQQLNVPGLSKLDIDMTIAGERDTLSIGFSRPTDKAKSESGQLLMDISKKDLAYQLNYVVKDASLDYFNKKYYKRKLTSGEIDYAVHLKTSGSNWAQIKQNLGGDIEIVGDSLRLYGVDVDDILRKYQKSQNFNLADLGAVLVAGPVGLAVTKGSDFVSLASVRLDSTEVTNIQTLVAKWKLESGMLITEDVAFATRLNRIAFNGQLDLAHDSIPGLTIAVLDEKGCSLMDQTLYGKMGAIQHGKLNITKTLLGSVINFVNAVVGKDCTPVYTGRVRKAKS